MGSQQQRTFAIVPAAGRSRRMGDPKLLLPWPTRGAPHARVIDRVLDAWTSSSVVATLVVVRADDEALAAACRAWPVRVVLADPPPRDMKASIQLALRLLEAEYRPGPRDHCFIAPADLPALRCDVIARLQSERDHDRIVVPRFGDKTGHPVLLPWSFTQEIFELGDDEGVNALTARHPMREIAFDRSQYVGDVDTPQEYQASLARWRRNDRVDD